MEYYLKYLSALAENNKKYQLTNNEQLLLDVVATALDQQRVIYVKDLISLKHIASQATLHKALSSLIDKDLIKLITDKQDGRLKTVHLTRLANKRYGELSRALVAAVKK